MLAHYFYVAIANYWKHNYYHTTGWFGILPEQVYSVGGNPWRANESLWIVPGTMEDDPSYMLGERKHSNASLFAIVDAWTN